MGGGGGGSSAAQNYTAVQQAQLSADQLKWAKDVYAQEAPDRAAAQDLATQSANASIEQQRQQIAIQQQAADDYNNTFRPNEQKLAADAAAYDTPERRAAESAAAVSSVEQNLAQQRQATERENERAGINPNSNKTLAMQGSLDLNAAKIKAGAGNAASKAVETVGYARRMDVANLGRNIASSQGTSAALGLQAGSVANANAAAGLAAGQSGNANMNAGFAGAQQGLAGSAQTFGAVAAQDGAASASKNASIAAGVGAVATIAVVI